MSATDEIDLARSGRAGQRAAPSGRPVLQQGLGERIDVQPVVDALRPLILAAEPQIERDRQLPPDLVEALYEAGIFYVNHPREFGGLELHPLDSAKLLFELSRISGSVGWIAMIQSGGPVAFEPDVMRELYDRAGGRYIEAGSFGRIGTARQVEGGYRFTGHWAFASGAPWATYITAAAHIVGDDGELLRSPFDGEPMFVQGFFPRAEVNYIEGSWKSLGLRGTGSGEFTLEDAFVERRYTTTLTPPEAYRDRALFRSIPTAVVALVGLGAAQGAIDRFIELANAKRRANSWANRANSLGSEQLHQVRIAHADAIVRAARTWIEQLALRNYASAFGKDPVAQYEAMVQAGQADVYGCRVAKEAVNLVFDIAGTDSVIEGRGIERCFRDVHTATQHSLRLENRYAISGQYYLTRDLPDGPIIDAPNALLPPAPPKGAAAKLWRLDPLHSSIGFRVRHHAASSFRAYFDDFSAVYDADAESITGSAKVASVMVFDALKEHLLGPDFLGVAEHPEVSFASTSLTVEGDALTVDGELTLKGTTKPVTARGVIVGPSRDHGFGPDNEYIGMELEVTIDRRDFGIAFNNELLDGQLNLGWDVGLTFSLEFGRAVAA